jgi:hypothetical protein
MLWCIIYRTEQHSALDLCQCSTLRKGLIKYGKINGIIPTKTHVESAYPKLVARKKLAIVEELVIIASHNQQPRKNRSKPSGCAITSCFSATNPYKNSDESQH